jgi:tetratricopeptide (TPR) repeat protein
MSRLDHSDALHLEAALGWLGLGNWREANEELYCISPEQRVHPEVLAARWVVCAKAGTWQLALEIAGTLAAADVGDSFAVVRLALTLDKLNRVQEAYDLLVAAAPNFPEDHRLRYDLARYCCKLGKLDEAMHYLETAIDRACANDNDIRQKALDDPALEPLWVNIGEI